MHSSGATECQEGKAPLPNTAGEGGQQAHEPQKCLPSLCITSIDSKVQAEDPTPLSATMTRRDDDDNNLRGCSRLPATPLYAT